MKKESKKVRAAEQETPKVESLRKKIDIKGLNSTRVKLVKDSVVDCTPTYAHDGDMGADVYATDVEYDVVKDAYVYHTGIHMETLKSIGCLAFPRSINTFTEAYLPNSVGVIDTVTYRGELVFVYKNRMGIEELVKSMTMEHIFNLPWWKRLFVDYNDVFMQVWSSIDPMDYAPYECGDKVGQLVFIKFQKAIFEEVEKLSETDRGEGGFGSTGK